MNGHLVLNGPGGIANDIYFTRAFTLTFRTLPAVGASLRITAPGYLTVDVPLNGGQGAAQYLQVTLPVGDANNDNSIDATDFGIFVSAYNSDASVPGSGYDARADFNSDGLVDPTDFGLFVGNYGAVGDN